MKPGDRKRLDTKVARICRKFYEDLQAVFDDAAENVEGSEDWPDVSEVYDDAVSAQSYADDAANAGGK